MSSSNSNNNVNPPTDRSSASMTQLPPSPELKPFTIQQQSQSQSQSQSKSSLLPIMTDFSLDASSSSPGASASLIGGDCGTSTSASAATANVRHVMSSAASSSSSLFDTTPLLIRRLRSVARYQAFHPQALACSNTLTASSDEQDSYHPIKIKSTGGKQQRQQQTSTTPSTHHNNEPSSLGAVAGSQGVALFRLSRPHVPLLILSHATNSNSNSNSGPSAPRSSSISSLAFQPTTYHSHPKYNTRTTSSLYLAATRGSGVLIWDASGHSPSPLIGRLGMENSSDLGGTHTSRITSIAWKPSLNSTSPLLATTTASSLSLWDLRASPSSSIFKPTLRFGTTARTNPNKASSSSAAASSNALVQVACSSDTEDCATIDASGMVRVYDVRMTERGGTAHRGFGMHNATSTPVSSFLAHDTAGVGISYFRRHTHNSAKSASHSATRWLTWGLDTPLASAVIKVWSQDYTPPTRQQQQDPDDYWYMGADSNEPSPRRLKPNSSSTTTPLSGNTGSAYGGSSSSSDYSLVAQCLRPNLACARVCALPVENSFMALGHLPAQHGVDRNGNDNGSEGGWWAELFSLNENNDTDNKQSKDDGQPTLTPRTFGVSKLVGFQGGTATSSADKKALVSVLGGSVDPGGLQAAEIAFSSGVMPSPSSSGELNKSEDENNDVELLLCCLSDTGVVTTHVIPEAIPRPTASRTLEIARKDSPRRGGSRSNMIRTAFPSTNQARVYLEDREGTSLYDAAGFWGGPNSAAGGVDPATKLGEEVRSAMEQQNVPSPQKSTEMDDQLVMAPSSRRNGEGGLMPFDMDVPVAYGSVTTGNMGGMQLGITDITSGAVSTTGMGVVEEGEPASVDIQNTTSIMKHIETERVPCPRLCGAVFGSGNGGLVIFHNGEVKKMWDWYQRTDNIRISSLPNAKGDTASTELDSLRMVHNASGTTNTQLTPQVEESPKKSLTVASAGPRTLKELVNMMATAKEAQWGERNSSDDSDSDGVLSTGDNFFEDDSSDSNSSDSGEEAPVTPPPADEMYKRYFGGRARRGAVEKMEPAGSPSRGTPNTESPASARKMRSFDGPSSDMLTPVVSLTHAYDSVMLNHQSVALANGWELGGWDVLEVVDSYQNKEDGSYEVGKMDSPESDQARGLPQYQYLQATPTKKARMPRTKSDPNLGKFGRGLRPVKYPMDEPGVHGGEYSVRPNMEESMTFLKKLFTHQQEGGAGFPTLLSPPDSPQLYNRRLTKEKRPSSTGQILRYESSDRAITSASVVTGAALDAGTGTRVVIPLGVYIVREEKKGKKDEGAKELKNIKRICLHNASVCESLGEIEKQGVWNLLAETVESQMNDKGQDFSGWGGNGGGALGVDLVSNFLKYYESLGDVQMLATMFCVLSGGGHRTRRKDRPYLLPRGQDEKYDSYIRTYAELLYSWGLLSFRAELNKHLLRIPPAKEEEKTETGRSPGIAVVFQCPRCGQDADFNTNLCRACQDFAFRCSICDNAVQGLFTVCDICNHGGHVEHMKSWFTSHVECPTGCGCNCTFSPLIPPPTEVVTIE